MRSYNQHMHKCPICQHVWAHSSVNAGSVEAHTCEMCYNELPHPWPHYFPEGLDVGETASRRFGRQDQVELQLFSLLLRELMP